jgi:Cys-tRNA(Pro)/Cys-tRNA(Cys) deacylase
VAFATNVTRMLEAKGIPYRALEIPNRKLNALEVAEHLKVPPEIVFKTIVAEREKQGKAILALVPATGEVDVKKLAKAAGEKKVGVTTLEKAEKMTGLRAGGISPLALMHKGFDVYLDTSALELEEIIISGGQWGLQIGLNPHKLMQLVNARAEEIT